MAATTTLKTFRYVAVDPDTGQRLEARMRAASERAVASELEAAGIQVGPIRQTTGANDLADRALDVFRQGGRSRISTSDLAMATKQLEVLMRSGLSVADALDAATEAAPSDRLAVVLREVSDRVRSGMTLTEALNEYQQVFSESYRAWVSSAEQTGRLDRALADLHAQLAQQARIEAEYRSATAYPKWSLVLSIVLAVAMVRWLVPQFATMLASFGSELPAPTRVLVTLNERSAWLIGGLTVTYFTVRNLRARFRDDLNVGPAIDQVLYRTPVFGRLAHQQVMFRWASTLAGLQTAGVHLDVALEIAGRASGSRWLRSTTGRVVELVNEGQPLSVALDQAPAVTTMLRSMIATGERTGQIPEMLRAAADAQAAMINATIGGLSKSIETISMLGVLAVVGSIVAALWLPILSLSAASFS